jgi:hypothetical protein
MAVEFPAVAGHPNRVPFEGVLTLVDAASDKAPSGARGHRVVLTREAAEAALPSLLGMAVDFKAGWDGHDAKQKCGIITAAEIDSDAVHVSGYLFARDFTEMMTEMHAHGDEALGMSYELADAHVENMRAEVWRLTKATFTGAAILLRSKAAYATTSFRVVRAERHGIAASCSTRTRLKQRAERAPAMRPMPLANLKQNAAR